MLHTGTESSPKSVLRRNRSDVGLQRSRASTWTDTNVQ